MIICDFIIEKSSEIMIEFVIVVIMFFVVIIVNNDFAKSRLELLLDSKVILIPVLCI